ncbi:unnamed protein product, partial [Laminaria digitata]
IQASLQTPRREEGQHTYSTLNTKKTSIMSSVAQCSSTENVITLRGSTDVVTDFFYYAVNSVLYQRGVYHPDSFARVAKYGITTLVTTDEGLTKYLDNVIQQLKDWLLEKELQRLVLVVVG